MNDTNFAEVMSTLDALERAGDRVTLAFDIHGRGVSIEGVMTAEQARTAINVAASLGATRFTIFRFDG